MCIRDRRAGLSAGRVQSVATRMVVERERERMAFRAASYWDVEGEFEAKSSQAFTAKLTGVDGERVASGRDFGDDGRLKSSGVRHLDGAAAEKIAEATRAGHAEVSAVSEKPYSRKPSAPFITSTPVSYTHLTLPTNREV